MRGCLSYRKPNYVERYIYMGNGKSVDMEAIVHFGLLRVLVFYLNLKDTLVVPSFRRNLVSVSHLDKFGYSCSFGNNLVQLSLNSNEIGTGSLMVNDNLYMLNTIADYCETLNVESCGTKRKIENNNSVALWHKRVGYNSNYRIE